MANGSTELITWIGRDRRTMANELARIPGMDVDRLMDGIEDYSRQWRGATPFEAAADTGYARRWNVVEEPPDNVLQYPTRRASGY
jgi:hypothetical protein